MRAPSPPFRAALDEYIAIRKQAIARENRRKPHVPSGFASADRELLARWKTDDRAEEVWRVIAEQSEKISTTELIQTILDARRSAQASVNRDRMFKDELAAVLPAVNERLAKLSSRTPHLGPLEAQEVRDLRRELFAPGDHLGLPGQQKFELSRKDQSGSRVRRLFVQIVSHYLHECGGRWFDKQVAILAEIAFPSGKDLDPEDIKKSRTRRGTFDPQSRG